MRPLTELVQKNLRKKLKKTEWLTKMKNFSRILFYLVS
jgi:hypothetical protein